MTEKRKARTGGTGKERTHAHYSIRAILKRLIAVLASISVITPGYAVDLMNKWRLW